MNNMNRQREHEIREVLVDHIATQTVLHLGLAAAADSLAAHSIIRAMIHCERRQADEIARLFSRDRRMDKAFICPGPDCGCWQFSEYNCECTQKLDDDEKARAAQCEQERIDLEQSEDEIEARLEYQLGHENEYE